MLQVASVQNYGAFVKIPGCSNQGLVHRSQISKVNVPDVSEVLAKGDRVWCKIVNTTVSTRNFWLYINFWALLMCNVFSIIGRWQNWIVNESCWSRKWKRFGSCWCTDEVRGGICMKFDMLHSVFKILCCRLDEQRRKEWTPGDKRKTISLEAVFNTTCNKCGTRGHLSKDCFQVLAKFFCTSKIN